MSRNEGRTEDFPLVGSIVLAVIAAAFNFSALAFGLFGWIAGWAKGPVIPPNMRSLPRPPLEDILWMPLGVAVGFFLYVTLSAWIIAAINGCLALLLCFLRRKFGTRFLPRILYRVACIPLSLLLWTPIYWLLLPWQHWFPFLVVLLGTSFMLLVFSGEDFPR